MHKGAKVLEMLIPNVGWAIQGEDFDSIVYEDGIPQLTKEQFEAGLESVDAWIAEQNAAKAATKQTLLDKLGITAEEAQLLLGGN
jgi:hypothetical protein